MAARTSRGPETSRSSTGSVNRFVNRTLRDGLRRGRRSRPDANAHRLYAEVGTVTGDGPRRQRRTSHGS